MTRLLALILLGACTDPHLGAALDFGPGGVALSPYVSGAVGGAGVTISN